MAPATCQHCGATVPRNARCCPECGADEETGWSDSAYASHLGIPDEKFNHSEFVQEEFGSNHTKPRGISWVWLVTALGLILLLLAYFFR
jgi:hypothetical protein